MTDFPPSPRPSGADLTEVLRRLSVMEQKLDWIAQRVARADETVTAPSQRAARLVAQPAPLQPASPVPLSDPFIRPAGPAAASVNPAGGAPGQSALAAPSGPGTVPAPTTMGAARPVPAAPPRPTAPSRSERARREGNLGRYLLSGAAALLVMLAAVTLIALVWSSVPDVAKVGVLAVIAGALVVSGTLLQARRPSQRVAAATLSGTGGALGYVAVLGAVLLPLGVPVLAAFVALALWGVILLVLAYRTEQVLAAAISSVGAMVTTGFTSWFIVSRDADPASTWSAVTVYLAVLATLGSILSRRSTGDRAAACAPVVASMAASLFTSFVVPTPVLELSPAWLALLLGLTPVVILLIQVLEAAPGLHTRGLTVAGVLDLSFATFSAVLLALRLTAAGHGASLTLGIVLILLGAAGAVLLLDRGSVTFRRQARLAALVMTALAGLVATTTQPVLVLLALVALVPTTLGGARTGSSSVALVGPLVAASVVLLPRSSATADALVIVTLLAAGGLAVLAEVSLAPEPVAPAGRTAAITANPTSSRPVILLVGAWLVGVAVVLSLPACLGLLLDRSRVLDQPDAGSVTVLLMGLAAAAVSEMGLTAGAASPVELLTGRRAGQRPGRRVVDGVVHAVPTVPGLATLTGLVMAGLAILQLGVAEAHDDLLWSAFHVLVATGLTVLAVRALLPWGRRMEIVLPLAALCSVVLWWSASLITGTSLTSVLMTIVVLGTGAACVIVGFRARATFLRHYGLALVLLAVIKLALLDVGAQSSLTRVLALLAAGLVCFGLSLAYNKAAGDLRPGDASGTMTAVGRPGSPTTPAGAVPPATTTAAAPPSWAPQWPPASGPHQRAGDERFRPPSR